MREWSVKPRSTRADVQWNEQALVLWKIHVCFVILSTPSVRTNLMKPAGCSLCCHHSSTAQVQIQLDSSWGASISHVANAVIPKKRYTTDLTYQNNTFYLHVLTRSTSLFWLPVSLSLFLDWDELISLFARTRGVIIRPLCVIMWKPLNIQLGGSWVSLHYLRRQTFIDDFPSLLELRGHIHAPNHWEWYYLSAGCSLFVSWIIHLPKCHPEPVALLQLAWHHLDRWVLSAALSGSFNGETQRLFDQ